VIETLLAFSSMLFISLIAILLWGNGKYREGVSDSEGESQEEKIERITRGVEKLMGPRPTRSVLIKHWERRLRKATKRDRDTPLPDSERGDN
jgi:hypothetical protein